MEEYSMMEEDIDIYADLSLPQDKSIEKCKKCSELETQIDKLKKEVKELKKVNRSLELNISSLLMTAKAEVSRKDRMIAELRRQLDDASFRRGNFKHHRNYKSNFNSEANRKDSVVFNPNKPPPPLPVDFRTVVPPPPLSENIKMDVPPPQLPENFHPDIPPPPLHKNVKTEDISPRSPEVFDETEYICHPEPLFEEEDEDPEQKYDDGINRDTLFSRRLRKRLEEEKELEQKEKKQKAVVEEAERKENEKIKEMRGGTLKINLDNKENKPCLVNTSSTRSREYEEPIEIKRLKVEPLSDPGLDDFREDWSEPGAETVKIKEEPCSSNLDYHKKREEVEDSKNLECRNNLASRLYLLSEGVSLDSTSRNDTRKDSEKRKEDENKFRDREMHEKERYENDKYKDKFLRERYEKDKYKEKLERERYERDKFDKEWFKHEREKFEREKFEREKYERKFEKDRHDRKRFRRSPSFSPERNYKFYDKREIGQKRFKFDEFDRKVRERNERFNRKVDLREKLSRSSDQESKYTLDNYNFRKGKEISRNDYRRSRSNSFDRNKREKEIFKGSFNSRSRSNSKDKSRKESELWKTSCNSERSRSNSKDKSYKNLDRKITFKDYKESRSEVLLKKNSSERSRGDNKDIDQRIEERKLILEMQKVKLEMELRKFDFEKSRSSGKEKDCKFISKDSKEKDEDVKVPGSENCKFSDLSEEFTNTNLEEGEYSDSSHFDFLPSQTHEAKREEIHKSLDNSAKKIEDNKNNLEKTVEDSVEKLEIEDGGRKENITNQLSLPIIDLKPVSMNEVRVSNEPEQESKKIIVDDPKKLEKPEGTLGEKSKEEIGPVAEKEILFVSQLQDKSETPNVEIDIKLSSPAEKVNLDEFSEKNTDTKLDLRLVVNQKEDLEKHVQTLDSFIESAKQVLEENKKEANRIEEVARKIKEKKFQEELEKDLKKVQKKTPESEKKIKVDFKEEVTITIERKKQKESKYMKDLSSPAKEGKKPERAESKKREEEKELSPVKEKNSTKRESKEKEEGEISSPEKKKIKQKRKESKEREGKEVFSSTEDTESKQQIKEDAKIKAENKKEEIETIKPSKELNQAELKNEKSQISSPVKDQREKIGPEVEVSCNKNSVKERRTQIQQKQAQSKLIEAQELKETQPKPKEPMKQVQKVKEDVPEKPKTRKAEEKPKKKIVVRKRKKPPVLSDCNASTTIVLNENVITNIKLNNSGDKNLLS